MNFLIWLRKIWMLENKYIILWYLFGSCIIIYLVLICVGDYCVLEYI